MFLKRDRFTLKWCKMVFQKWFSLPEREECAMEGGMCSRMDWCVPTWGTCSERERFALKGTDVPKKGESDPRWGRPAPTGEGLPQK